MYDSRKAKNITYHNKVIRSFSVDEDVLKALQSIAEKRRTSFNALINELLIEFVSIKHLAEDTGCVQMDSCVLKALMKSASIGKEEALVAGENTFEKWAFLRNIDKGDRAFLEVLRSLFEWSRFGRYTEILKDNQLRVRVAHEFGDAWSDFLTQFIIGGHNKMSAWKVSEDNFTRTEDGFSFAMPFHFSRDQPLPVELLLQTR